MSNIYQDSQTQALRGQVDACGRQYTQPSGDNIGAAFYPIQTKCNTPES
ncbi:hypothetical protein Y11_10271 [Yersinia enterocolitica subsp. palearctica Y11]|uniref:Uncharacterized protein n=1 Tax=Yersinia enterocolitica subsp. palearctica serotype O:3 (strain DSM 13030 / CIP 106945 / Y11) TaxID=930944 RepID=A0A0H3NPW2_YERE1|nr:hypothetical protein Y11_10271 [Yersinia enterocolitica subsp. palearctica Y11]CCO68711.1 hypothetical protein D322_1837 [Yersinia enterocolitica IP 10393]